MGRRSSVQLLQEDEAVAAKFSRRISSGTGTPDRRRSSAGFRKRLGIRRSMDLSGEAIEAYKPKRVVGIDDEPDELKKTVVMETIMTAADVAHNLQVSFVFGLIAVLYCD